MNTKLNARLRGLLSVAAMLLVASSAFAQQGYNLAWSNCAADAGTTNFTFACASNIGTRSMVGTFVLGQDEIDVSGTELVVDLISQDPVLPEWWNLWEARSCRPKSLSIEAHDGASCPDWALLKASMNIAAYYVGQPRGANTARILGINAVLLSAVQDLVAKQEYGAFRLNVANELTTGADACPGCANPVCIVLTRLVVAKVDGTSVFMQTPVTPGSQIITWQGAGADCQLVPVKNATWGAVKSLYR